MYTFTYWDNSKKWHGWPMGVVVAASISEADKDFEGVTGINPAKTGWISCQIKKLDNQDSVK